MNGAAYYVIEAFNPDCRLVQIHSLLLHIPMPFNRLKSLDTCAQFYRNVQVYVGACLLLAAAALILLELLKRSCRSVSDTVTIPE